MDIKRIANLLSADAQLENVERQLKRIAQRRLARQIFEIRELLRRALDTEQTGLQSLFSAFVETGLPDGEDGKLRPKRPQAHRSKAPGHARERAG